MGYVQGLGEAERVVDLSPDRVRVIVTALSGRTCCRHYSHHDLRRFFAILAYTRGVSAESVRPLLGHKRLDIMQRHLDFAEEVVAEDYRRAFES